MRAAEVCALLAKRESRHAADPRGKREAGKRGKERSKIGEGGREELVCLLHLAMNAAEEKVLIQHTMANTRNAETSVAWVMLVRNPIGKLPQSESSIEIRGLIYSSSTQAFLPTRFAFVWKLATQQHIGRLTSLCIADTVK